MADQTLYNTTTPSQGSLALAHQKLIRLKQSGVFANITGDINNLKLNPSDVVQTREVYGAKGTNKPDVIAKNYAPTFSVEVVRDPVTKEIVASQAWFIDLYKAAHSTGIDNKREFQILPDALDERMPAFQGTFNVAVDEGTTGHADKTVYNFTLTNDGPVEQITSPIAGDGKPLLDSASPTGQTVGDLIVVRGYRLTGTTGATIDGQTVVEFRVVDDNTIVLQIPEDVTGSAPIVITNAAGASSSLPYTAATV